MVLYLNSLRTQNHGGNPSYVHETRQAFLDQLRARWDWFPRTEELYVESKLDALVKAIDDGRVDAKVIFLTGDAGDGKTAICDRVAKRLGRPEELDRVTQIGDWTIVKDASETAEDDLRALIRRHLDGTSPLARLMVAINEGRLRRILRTGHEARPGLWEAVISPALDARLDEEGAKALDARMKDEHVLVLNFRHRFHVRLVTGPLLSVWTRSALWEQGPVCRSCQARATCPILANIQSLRDQGVQRHLADLLTSVHFSGQRLPFRRLQALLALACTSGLTCDDAQKEVLSSASAALDRLRYRYYAAVFPPEPGEPVRVQREPLTNALSSLDPGRFASRDFDEEVAAIAAPVPDDAQSLTLVGLTLPKAEEDAVRAVRSSAASGSASLSSDQTILTRSLRRWAALAGGIVPPGMGWPRATQLLEDYASDKGDADELKRQVLISLNLLHRVPGPKSDSLAAKQVDPGGFRDPMRLALEVDLGTEFEVRLRKGPVLPLNQVTPWLEGCPSEIALEARPKGASGEWAPLQLDARLVEALLGVIGGYAYLGVLGSYRRDLARFFSRLAQLARKAGKVPVVFLRFPGRQVRVTSEGGKLRFNEG
jgi:hypothetical protein